MTLLAHDSRTAFTWAKRFAHSRLVMMMISSAASIASCRFLGGAIGNSVSARPRATCVSLFMITGQRAPSPRRPPRRPCARWACSSSVMIVTTSPCSTVKQVSTMSSACSRSLPCGRHRVLPPCAERRALGPRSAGSTSRANRSTCPNWSSEPKRQMKWSTPAAANVRNHSMICSGSPDRAPVVQVHGLGQLRVVLPDVVAEGRPGRRPPSRRC